MKTLFWICSLMLSFSAGVGVMAHVATKKLDALALRQIQIGDQHRQAFEISQATAAAWQRRAESCEARKGAVMIEPHRLVGNFPVLPPSETAEKREAH